MRGTQGPAIAYRSIREIVWSCGHQLLNCRCLDHWGEGEKAISTHPHPWEINQFSRTTVRWARMVGEIRGECEVSLPTHGALCTILGEKIFVVKVATEGVETGFSRLKNTAPHCCAETSRHEPQESPLNWLIVSTAYLSAVRFSRSSSQQPPPFE